LVDSSLLTFFIIFATIVLHYSEGSDEELLTMEDIIRDGHPVLRQIAEDVPLPATDEDKKTLKALMEYVQNSQNPEIAAELGLRPGIGLAAPQINVLKRMIAVHLTDEKERVFSYALFNPKIISHSVEKAFLASGEGCLSIDEQHAGYVPRYARVTVKGYDIDGTEVKVRLKGLPAICFQHEIDHLNGILFYDHIDKENPMKIPENAIMIQ
jgi:peptide deformylase